MQILSHILFAAILAADPLLCQSLDACEDGLETCPSNECGHEQGAPSSEDSHSCICNGTMVDCSRPKVSSKQPTTAFSALGPIVLSGTASGKTHQESLGYTTCPLSSFSTRILLRSLLI